MITRVYNNLTYYTKIRLPSIRHKRYLIRWEPNHYTKIHNHDGYKCNMYLLYGGLKEERYVMNDKYYHRSNIISNKFLDNSYITDDMGSHVINNLLNKYSYSYHVYKK